MWLDEGRFDLLTNQRRLTPPTAARIDQLIEARAWNDAALALVELELPAWKLRRLVYEDGEWHCSLSRQPNLPVALEDCNRKSRSAALSDIRCACRSPPQDERYARHQFAGGTATSGNIWLRGLLR